MSSSRDGAVMERERAKPKFPQVPTEEVLGLLAAAMACCAASSFVAVMTASTAQLVVIDSPRIELVDTTSAGAGSNATNITTILPQFVVSVGLFDFCNGGTCYHRQSTDFVPAISSFLLSWNATTRLQESSWNGRLLQLADSSLRFGFSQAEQCGFTTTSFAVVSGVVLAGWAMSALVGFLAAVSCAWLCVLMHELSPQLAADRVRKQRAQELNLRYLAGLFSALQVAAVCVAFALTLWSLFRRWGCASDTYCDWVTGPINAIVLESNVEGTEHATCDFGLSFYFACISFGLAVLSGILLLIVTVPLLHSRARSTKRYFVYLTEQLSAMVLRSPPPRDNPAARSPQREPSPVSVIVPPAPLPAVTAPLVLDSDSSQNDFSERSPTPPRRSVDSSGMQQVAEFGAVHVAQEDTPHIVQSSSLLSFTQRSVVTRTGTTTSRVRQVSEGGASQVVLSPRQAYDTPVEVSLEDIADEEAAERGQLHSAERAMFGAMALLHSKTCRSDNLVVFHECTLDWLFGPVLDLHLHETFARQALMRRWHSNLRKLATEPPPLPLPYFLALASHYTLDDGHAPVRYSSLPTEQWLAAVDRDFCSSPDDEGGMDVSPVAQRDAPDDVEVSSASDDEATAARRRSSSSSNSKTRKGEDEQAQEVDELWSLQKRYAMLVKKTTAHAARSSQHIPGTQQPAPPVEVFDKHVQYELSLLKASVGRSIAADQVPRSYRSSERSAAAVFSVDASWGVSSVDDRLAKLRQAHSVNSSHNNSARRTPSSSSMSSATSRSADQSPSKADTTNTNNQ